MAWEIFELGHEKNYENDIGQRTENYLATIFRGGDFLFLFRPEANSDYGY